MGPGQFLTVLNGPKHTFAVCTGSSVLSIVTCSWQSSVPGGKSLGSLLCTELTAPHLQDSGRQRPQHLETAFRRWLVGDSCHMLYPSGQRPHLWGHLLHGVSVSLLKPERSPHTLPHFGFILALVLVVRYLLSSLKLSKLFEKCWLFQSSPLV